jgi:uncharacterized repeat protein (TIGR04138 family)
MERDNDFGDRVDEVVKKDPRYKPQSYAFVMGALDYTLRKLEKPRHITGWELLQGIKELAKEEFGPTAKLVLEHWGIKNTENFGNIVFNLVEAGIMSKTEEDKIEDFKEVFDFTEEFEGKYKMKVDKEKLK